MRSVDEAAAAVLDYLEREGRVRPRWRSRLLDTPNGDRLVAEFSFDGQTAPSEPLIAKCYDDDTGAHTFRVMVALAETIRRHPTAALAVPEALSYDSTRRCLVQRRAPGSVLLSFVDNDQTAACRLVGEALAELHGLDLPIGESKSVDEHLEELIHPHPLELAQRLPEHRSRIESLVRVVKAEAARFRDAFVPRSLHRDFHSRQLFIEGQHLWVIDWDLYGKGDPALDVGNFLMSLETRYPERHRLGQEAFLAGYRDRGAGDLTARIPLYKGLNYLRRASKHFRLAEPGWAARTEAMLDRAERCLAAG
jgi:aminoglycoside phosphotransferase (APT) family kinase protein